MVVDRTLALADIDKKKQQKLALKKKRKERLEFCKDMLPSSYGAGGPRTLATLRAMDMEDIIHTDGKASTFATRDEAQLRMAEYCEVIGKKFTFQPKRVTRADVSTYIKQQARKNQTSMLARCLGCEDFKIEVKVRECVFVCSTADEFVYAACVGMSKLCDLAAMYENEAKDDFMRHKRQGLTHVWKVVKLEPHGVSCVPPPSKQRSRKMAYTQEMLASIFSPELHDNFNTQINPRERLAAYLYRSPAKYFGSSIKRKAREMVLATLSHKRIWSHDSLSHRIPS